MPSHRALNVFVLDREQRPIPEAEVTVLLDGEAFARATTRGLADAPVSMQVPEMATGLSLQVRVGEQTWHEPIAGSKVNHTFSLSELAVRSQLKVFVSYAHKDRRHMERLGLELRRFERRGLLHAWFDGRMLGGDDFDTVIKKRLEESQIVLLLVSPDFVGSKYCMETEVPWALARRDRTDPIVLVPIVVRSTADLQHEAFGNLLMLPKDGKPVSKWRPIDDAWKDVVENLGRIFDAIQPAAARNAVDAGSLFTQNPEFKASLLRLQENPTISKAARLPQWVRLAPPPLPDTPFDPDDPQRERWGGRSEVEGLRLTATVRAGATPEWFDVVLTVERIAAGGKLDEDVYFYLHHTFAPPRVKVTPDPAGRAVHSLSAWGAFTVGVWIDNDQHTTLELNLAALEQAPLTFRRR